MTNNVVESPILFTFLCLICHIVVFTSPYSCGDVGGANSLNHPGQSSPATWTRFGSSCHFLINAIWPGMNLVMYLLLWIFGCSLKTLRSIQECAWAVIEHSDITSAWHGNTNSAQIRGWKIRYVRPHKDTTTQSHQKVTRKRGVSAESRVISN